MWGPSTPAPSPGASPARGVQAGGFHPPLVPWPPARALPATSLPGAPVHGEPFSVALLPREHLCRGLFLLGSRPPHSRNARVMLHTPPRMVERHKVMALVIAAECALKYFSMTLKKLQ